MKLWRRYAFEAAHQLHGLPDTHPCSRVHGHGYRLEVAVSGPVDGRGMVIEYADLDALVKMAVLDDYDHHDLNGLHEQPTVENMVVEIFDRLTEATPLVVGIRLWETERSSVEYP